MKQTLVFIALAVLFTSCSRKTAPQLMQEASDSLGAKSYTAAIERYQEIVDRFGQSAAAETALFRIASIYGNDVHDQRKALGAYELFCQKYPNSGDAPTALFLTGFIFNNELHLYDSARLAYESFLKKYPGHSLASSAQFELQTLGKDPAEFLQPQVAEGNEAEKNPKSGTAK